MDDDPKYPGIGIWIHKDYVEFNFESKLYNFIKESIPLEIPNVSFRGKQLLLLYDYPIKLKKLKTKISRLCVSKGIFCHVITMRIRKQIIIILNFNEIFKTKDTEIFDISDESPKWYPLNKYDYVDLMNLIQCDTYEETYLDAVKSYIDDKTEFIMDQLREFVVSMTTTLSETNKIEQCTRQITQCNDKINKIQHRVDSLCKDIDFAKTVGTTYQLSLIKPK